MLAADMLHFSGDNELRGRATAGRPYGFMVCLVVDFLKLGWRVAGLTRDLVRT